jgi:hypothetical protein
MTTRRSIDLSVPPPERQAEAPLPANVLDFFAPPRLPFDVSPIAVLLMALRQRERATREAVARHQRRKGRRDTTTWADLRSRGTGS